MDYKRKNGLYCRQYRDQKVGQELFFVK